MAAPARPHDVHDRWVKRVFGRKAAFAVVLRRVLPPDFLAHLDLRSLAKHSTERTDEHLRSRISDLCFTAELIDAERRLPVLFPLEHYSTPSRAFPFRAVACASELWHEHLANHPKATEYPLIAPILLVQPGARSTPTQLSTVLGVPRTMRALVPSPIELRAYVDDLTGSVLDDPEADLATLALVELARAFLHAQGNPAVLTKARLATLAPLFDVLLDQPEPLATQDIRALMTYIHGAFPNGSPVRALIENALHGRSRKMFISIADALIAKGRSQGRRAGLSEGRRAGLSEGRRAGLSEGRRVGRAEGLARALLGVLEHRFSSVPAAVRRRIAASRDEQGLARWLERALTAESPADVFADDD